MAHYLVCCAQTNTAKNVSRVLLPLNFVMAEPAQVERLVNSLFPHITSVKKFYADEALLE